MAKRIFLSKFRFYLNLGSIPILVFGLILSIYPKLFFDILKMEYSNLSHFFIFIFRILGILCVYVYSTFLFLSWKPNECRDLAFFQSLLLLICGVFTVISPFLWSFSYFLLLLSLYFFSFGIFLFMFSSKNLLVRE